MSINHYSSDTPKTTLCWPQQQQQQQQATSEAPIPIYPSWHPQFFHQPTWLNSSSMNPPFNLNNQVEEDEVDEDDEDNAQQAPLDDDQATATATTSQQGEEEEKEAMFEKPLTPSDVGKLNRLVIPKQHAEKYFPLGGGDSGESKGLLLSFEDESGKCWRFRYSYWNSSQSYVLTKGWSRYVKDKRLDAGDVVLFQRHRTDANRLFISWRRRQPNGSTVPAHVSTRGNGCHSKTSSSDRNGNGVGGGNAATVPVRWTRGFYSASAHPYPTHHPLPYQPDSLQFHAGGGSQGQNQTTPVGNSSSSRVLRLFGVNMECQPDNDSENCRTECSYNMSSTQGTATHHFYHHQPSYSSSNPHHHMVRQQPY